MKTSLWLSGLIASALASPMARAQTSVQIQSELGKGVLLYDKDAGLKDRCIQYQSDQVVIEDARITSYELTLVKTKEELSDKISFSASAKGSYGLFSGGAKSSFVREIDWNFNSNYILVRATRVTKKQIMNQNQVLLTNQALNLFRDSKFRFLETCGNSFATIVEMGGEVYGLIEIKANTYEEKQRIETSINASGSFTGGSASGKTSYERTIRKLSSEYKVKINFQHIGGSQAQVPNTVDGLLELSNGIEKLSDEHPVPLTMVTRDYSTLSNYIMDRDDPEVAVRQNQIDWAQGKLNQARNLYAQILYVLENQRDFKRFDEETLKIKLVDLDEKIIQLKNFVARAYSFMNSADVTSLEVNLDISLPKMRNRPERRPLKVTCETKPSTLCGVKTYREQKSSACGVVAPLEGTGPVCGTIYKDAPSVECGVKAYKLGRGPVCGVELYQSCYHGRSRWGRPRPHGRDSSCGVELYRECRDPSFGVEAYNSCRHPLNGVEKYNTCRHKDFGYEFESCRHFSHGPDAYHACEVAKIGNQEAYCPKF